MSSGNAEIRARGQAEGVEVCVVGYFSDGFYVGQVILGSWKRQKFITQESSYANGAGMMFMNIGCTWSITGS